MMPLVASGGQVREMQGGGGGRSGATADDHNAAARVAGVAQQSMGLGDTS